MELQDKTSGRFRRRAVKVAEAQSRIMKSVERWLVQHARVERVPLHRSGGRYAAGRLHATCDWPPFARSGVDGFAVRAADTIGASPDRPVVLPITRAIAAGDAPPALAPGTAMRIMTGAMVPEQADAVVMLEQTVDAEAGTAVRGSFDSPISGQSANGQATAYVRIKQPAVADQHVAPRGEELQMNELLIERGQLIRPGHVALLGTFGYTEVQVYARPRVAIFATGSELLPVGQPLRPGQIRDSNSAMLAAMVEQSGGEATLYGSLPDELLAVRQALEEAWEVADMIVTTGGVSVGDYDVMAELMRSVSRQNVERPANPAKAWSPAEDDGSELLFDRVSMRPGSPTSAARIGGKLLFALSGNPGACFVGFELFVRPALLALQGEAQPLPKVVRAELVSSFDKGSPHDRYVRSRLYEHEGRVYVEPLGFAKSSMLASIPASDGLALIPSGSAGAAAGELVDVLLVP